MFSTFFIKKVLAVIVFHYPFSSCNVLSLNKYFLRQDNFNGCRARGKKLTDVSVVLKFTTQKIFFVRRMVWIVTIDQMRQIFIFLHC